MAKTLKYTPDHEAVLKRATGKSLDELLSDDAMREQARVKLYELSTNADVPAKVNKLAEELDSMLIHFEPGQREATWEDDDAWMKEFEQYLNKEKTSDPD